MTIKPKIVEMYDWSDIEKELCRIMDIPTDMFRDYHKVVGGKYKDFWHVCLEIIIPEHMANGSIVTMYSCEDAETFFEGEEAWKNKVLIAWNELYATLDKSGIDSGIEVSFFW